MEVRVSYALASELGAVAPKTVAEHRDMLRTGQYLLIRTMPEGLPLFWRLAPGLATVPAPDRGSPDKPPQA